MAKHTIQIEGMHCNSCERIIEEALKDKVQDIQVSYSRGEAEVEYNPERILLSEIKDIIKKSGYSIKGEEELKIKKSKKEESVKGEKRKPARNKSDYIAIAIIIVGIGFFLYWIYGFIGGFNLEIPGIGESGSILVLFIVGLLTGFHCVSMCGAFVVGYTTKNAEKGHKGFKQHFVYGGAKVLSYAIIGGIFGLIGGVLAFSVGRRAGVAIFAGLFMIAFALSMMGVKFFRRFQFNPKFLTRWTAKTTHDSKGYYKAPFMTGILSGLFIACGPLQALYLYAAGTGNFLTGFLSLGAFGLGTLPVLIGFGSLTSVISKSATRRILKITAIIVLILGLVMLNRGLTLIGSPVSYDALKATVMGGSVSGSSVISGDFQEVRMEVDRYGWEPNSFVLKKGIPVKWIIDVKQLTGCNNEIVVPSYNIDIKLKRGINTVEFTPEKVGTIRWSCWMGMIPGSFIVTDTGTASQREIESATPVASGSCGCGG